MSFLPIRGKSSAELERVLRQWEEDFWIDFPALEKIDVSMLILNREYGLWSKCTFHFIFFRGGLLTKEVTVEGIWLTTIWSHSHWLIGVNDVIWVLMNVYIVVSEGIRIKNEVFIFLRCFLP